MRQYDSVSAGDRGGFRTRPDGRRGESSLNFNTPAANHNNNANNGGIHERQIAGRKGQ